MSYCLIVKGADGTLRLVGDTPFATRAQALDALAAEAATNAVNAEDDHVWLVDLDAVAPVVLFPRPAPMAAQPEATSAEAPRDALAVEEPAAVGAEAQAEAPATDARLVEPAWAAAAGLAPEIVEGTVVEMPDESSPVTLAAAVAADELGAPTVPTFEPAPEPESDVEPELAAAPEPEPEPEPAVESGETRPAYEDVVATVAPVAIVTENVFVAPTEMILEEDAFYVEDSILDDLLLPPQESEAEPVETDDSFSDLREALARSAAQMEAEVLARAQVSESSEPASEEPSESAAEEPSEPAGEEEPSEPTPATIDAPVESMGVVAAAQEEDIEAAPSLPEGAASAWPWAAIADLPPVVDEVETVAAEPFPEPEDAVAEPFGDVVVAVEEVVEVAAAPEITVAEVTEVECETEAGAEPVIEPDLVPRPSEYVLEIDEVVAPTTVEHPGYTPGIAGVGSMTCEDCVWVDTCPNKDQREPASCGSFQWK